MIKSVVEKEKEKSRVYPYLGIVESTGAVVWFTAKDSGFCIKGVYAGMYELSGWDEDSFIPLKGSITLENS